MPAARVHVNDAGSIGPTSLPPSVSVDEEIVNLPSEDFQDKEYKLPPSLGPSASPLLQAREAFESECRAAFVAAAADVSPSKRQLQVSQALRARLGFLVE